MGLGGECWRVEVLRTSAAVRSAIKVVAATSVTIGGAPCWALLLPGLGWLRL